MKIKEIASDKKKVNEIKKKEKVAEKNIEEREEKIENEVSSENLELNGADKAELAGKEGEKKEFVFEDVSLKSEERGSNLEDFLSGTLVPASSDIEEESRTGDFYKTSNNDFYSTGSDFYGTSSNNLYGSGGEPGGNFYGTQTEDERIGEIRGEKISKLEIEGMKGGYGKKDRRKGDEKYKAKGY